MDRYQKANLSAPQSGYTGSGASSFASVASSSLESLSSRLESFSKSSFAQAGVEAQSQAARDATLDIAKRKEKINSIQATDKTLEAKQQEIQGVLEGQRQTDATIYGRAYNTAASATYANQVTTDASAAADIAAVQANGDPEAFYDMYNAFEKETVAGAPSPELAITAKRAFLQYGSAAYKTLSLAKQKEQRDLDKTTYTNAMEAVKNGILIAQQQGDLVQIQELTSKARSMADDAIKKGYTTEGIFNAQTQEFTREAFTTMHKSEFTKANAKGMGWDYINKFIKNEDVGNVLLVDERKKLIEWMNISVGNANQAEEAQYEKQKKAQEKVQTSTRKEMLIQLHEGTLSQDWLDYKHANSALTDSDWEKYSKMVGKPSEDIIGNEMLASRIEYGIEYYDSDDIYNAVGLNDAQRGKLLTERKQYEDNIEEEWAKSTRGKEAIRRLKDAFPKASTIMGSSFDEEAAIKLNELQSKFYDELLKIAPEEREQRALPLSNKILQEYKAEVKKEDEERRKKATELMEKTSSVEKEVFNKNVEQYAQNATEEQLKYDTYSVVMFKDSFGKTDDISFS